MLALDSLLSEKNHGEQLDVTVSVVEDSKDQVESSSPKNEGPALKQLPEHLHYAFLEGQFEFPVIISTSLSPLKEEKLIVVLRKYKSALAWSISDSKGIDPTIYMHKILIEESYKPSIEHQRRLNLAIKEVVRDEVLKLLNALIIYTILDSS